MSQGSEGPGPARIPVSTYRLQFGAGFTFRAARDVVPYLAAIGITDIYASPYFKAGPGSLSGYDIVDPNALDPRVGSEEDYQALIEEIRRAGMGQVLDIVPNHLCISCGGNAWWQDVLENGRSSAYASFFDIDWRPLGPGPEDKVLLPILASQYGDALEGQELRLAITNGSVSVLYREAAFPLAPETYPDLLGFRLEDLEGRRPAGDPDLAELRGLAAAFADLPPHTERDPGRVRERRREKEILKVRLAALIAGSPSISGFLDENVRLLNGLKGDHRSFDRLDELMGRQAWRLAHWRVSTDEINYRRFFDLNHLAAIRMEEPEVFERVHRLVLKLIEEGAVTGLRIDHTDGLADPAGYLRDLQEECRRRAPGAKGTTAETEPRPFYIVVEKILSGDESLPADWPVHGTTGYDFLNAANGLFVDSRNAALFDAFYARLTGAGVGFADVVYEKKRLVLQASMSGEANALARELKELAVRNRHTRDFTLNSLAKAIVEVIGCFPVYRAYVTAAGVRETDRGSIDRAVGEARRRNPAMSRSIFDFLRQVLLLEPPAEAEPGERAERWAFVRKFQQLTGPVMAKGVEDTAFYAYGRLVSLNEVGGRPDRFGASPEAFHAQNAERSRSWPFGLVTTSTHDAKRSEDVRARIDVLSEMPRAWRAHVVRWRRLNAKKRRAVGDLRAPDAEDEYLIYQTLAGAWPLGPAGAKAGPVFAGRIKDYILKAVREAKVHTSWIDPDGDYEDAVTGFITDILEDSPGNGFLRDFLPFQAAVSELGMYNSLSQTVLKIASPGVPDFYQGNEIWDFSLVDPDNRRPVDFAKRRELLESLAGLEAERPGGEVAERLMTGMDDGRIKLFVTSRALRHRRAHREVFERGEYLPMSGEGPRSRNVCGFVRSRGAEAVLALVSRFFTDLVRKPGDRPVGDAAWADSFVSLPPGLGARGYRNIFTGDVIIPSEREGRLLLPLGTVFARLPVALLEAS